ncbi:MAG: protein translocase subunit SecD, partial [Opitutales bacterium]
SFGLAETIVRKKGDRAVEIQIPDLSTKENPKIFKELQRPALLEFKKVLGFQNPNNSLHSSVPQSLYDENGKIREIKDANRVHYVAMPRHQVDQEPTLYYIKKYEEATGSIIESAYPSRTDSGGWEVAFDFNDQGRKDFVRITGEIASNNTPNEIGMLAIVLDGKLESTPTVRQRIDSKSARIEGSFSYAEAKALSDVLNNPLEIPLKIGEMYEVAATLAEDAYDSSEKACILGAGLVIVFMCVYYFAGGLLAMLSVGINILLVVAVMSYMNATFTLPGIAAIVLTVGMAVDANILIFERIREELRSGKTPAAALTGGFDKAFSTIVDANVTTLITAAILIGLGTGPVKGFGITLSIGIITSMFCALVVSRFLMDFLVNVMGSKIMISIKPIEKSDRQSNIDFLKYWKIAFLGSWALVAAGTATIYNNWDKILGIDFEGGEELIASFDANARLTPNQIEKVRASAKEKFGEIQSFYRQEIGNENNEKLVLQAEEGKGRDFFKALSEMHPQSKLKEDGFNLIGASVSSEIQNNAKWSIIFALIGILLYVALRFELGYAVGAVVATIHDMMMTIGLFVLLGSTGLCSGQFTAPMLAAILMIVGYSINDTIVVFDRIREELTMNPVTNLRKIILIAINRVLSRSILTSVTTLMAACSLWINGAGVVNDFAFVFVLGILTGTFSSIFIASPIFYWWHRGDRKHVEEGELLPKYEWDASSKASR